MMSRLWTSMQRGEQSTIKTRWRRRHEQINRFHCAFKHYNCTFFIVVACLPLTAAPPSISLSLSSRKNDLEKSQQMKWATAEKRRRKADEVQKKNCITERSRRLMTFHFSFKLSDDEFASIDRREPSDWWWMAETGWKQATREWSINYEKSPSWTKHNLVEPTTWVSQIHFNIQASARDCLGRGRGRCRKLLREHKKASN